MCAESAIKLQSINQQQLSVASVIK